MLGPLQVRPSHPSTVPFLVLGLRAGTQVVLRRPSGWPATFVTVTGERFVWNGADEKGALLGTGAYEVLLPVDPPPPVKLGEVQLQEDTRPPQVSLNLRG